jgi:hypothetical protein
VPLLLRHWRQVLVAEELEFVLVWDSRPDPAHWMVDLAALLENCPLHLLMRLLVSLLEPTSLRVFVTEIAL